MYYTVFVWYDFVYLLMCDCMSMFEYVEYGVGGNKYQKHIRVHKLTTKTYRYSIYTYNIENKTWNIAQFWKMLEC